MDRAVVYQGQIPLETDLLNTNKNAMVALGFLMKAVLGTSLSVDGLACTPNSPADMTVLVAPGSIHSLQNVDGTAYGTLPADTTNQIVKQGLSLTTQAFSCPAPVTTGHSIVYLIQAAYQDVDGGAAVLPYYNASDPGVPWSGPSNSGVSQNTVRRGTCLLGVKAGVSATTGSQVTPAPDAGYVGLYAVTVANGQTTITSGNIARLATAPFIDAKLPVMLSTIQSGAVTFAEDTSASANTITVSLNPVPSALTKGMRVAVKVANSVTGATVMNTNGLGNVAVVTTSGAALSANAMVANGIYTLVYDENGTRWQLQGFTAASATGLLPANNLSDVSNPATSLANLGGAPLASPALTGTPTAPTASPNTNSTQLATTAYADTKKIGQVVSVQDLASAQQTSTSTSYAAITGASISIAPATNTSKVKLSFTLGVTAGAASGAYIQLKRGSTVIATFNVENHTSDAVGRTVGGSKTITWVDSPATTSNTTYSLEFKRDIVSPTGEGATGTVTILAASTSARQYIAEEILP